MPKSSATQSRHLISIDQAATYANVHPMTIRRWIAAGRVPAYRVGPKLLRVDLNELEAMASPIPAGAHRAAS